MSKLTHGAPIAAPRLPAGRAGVPSRPAGLALGPRLGPASGRPVRQAGQAPAPVKRKRGRPRKNPT